MAYISKGTLTEILSRMTGGTFCPREAMTGQELSRMIMGHLAGQREGTSCGEEAPSKNDQQQQQQQ